MPELPEVETITNGIIPHCLNQTIEHTIVRQHQLRWPIIKTLPQKLKNNEIIEIKRRGKYIIISLSNGHLICHLGMSGQLKVLTQNEKVNKHDHVDIRFSNGTLLRYTDPRRFGAIVWTSASAYEHPLIKNLGPEPLEKAFNTNYLYAKCQHKKAPIKNIIMNANIVVGVGNIYASEALFKAKLNPIQSASTLDKGDCKRLVNAIKTILKKAINEGGTTLKDFVNAEGKPGYFQQQLTVYGREDEPCLICGKAIEKVVLAGRSSFYCHNCQALF